MSGDSCVLIGRVGGLAAALGIGAAIFTCAGAASAEPRSSESSDAAGSASGDSFRAGATTRAGRPAGQRGRATSAGTPGAHRAASTPSESKRGAPPPVLSAAVAAARPRIASTALPTAPAPVELPAAAVLPDASRSAPSGAVAGVDPQPAAPASPTLVLNGYAVVASTPLNVSSFYGKYSTGPSTAGSVQGTQRFDLVNQQTGEIVGKFGALVGQNNSFGLIGHRRVHTELLVTDVEEGTVGTGPGEVPPPSSRIGAGAIRNSGYGSVYSAMPEPEGSVVRWTLLTPFGHIPLPPFYDATKGFADYSEVNQPFSLGNGYSIGPANPENPWLTTAIAGLSPIYTVEQGVQKFRVYDTATGVTTGTFTGYTTPTRDALIFHTMAILVTDTEGSTNVGTGPGQVPPLDTVYNILYIGSIRPYVLYSSSPSASGDVISTKLVTPRRALELPFSFNASTPPPPEPFQVPGGYRFVPTSPLHRIGLNGLPPLDVLFQGYQQFDVLDPVGNKIGSVDADVSHQWNGVEPRALFSVQNTGMLITKVTSGTPGSGPGDVPPVGSVFNFLHSRVPGLERFYSALPSPTGNLITNMLVTPLGNIHVPTKYDAAAGLGDVTYVDHFAA